MKMSKYKRIVSIIMVAVMTFSLAACGKTEDSGIADDLQEIENGTQEDGGGQPVQTKGLAEKLNVPQDKVSYEVSVQGQSGSYMVDAVVNVPEESTGSIYEVKKKQVTAATLKDMAKNLFDGGSYVALRPYITYTTEELLEEEQALKEQLAETDKQELTETEKQKQNTIKRRLYDLLMIKEYSEQYEPAAWNADDFTEGIFFSAYDKIMVLEGTISEVTYDLMCIEANEKCFIQLVRQDAGFSWLFPRRSNVVLNDETISSPTDDVYLALTSYSFLNEIIISEDNDTVYGSNACAITREDAETMAKSYMEKLGVSDMEVVNVNSKSGPEIDAIANLWDAAQDEDAERQEQNITYQDGYVIYLEPVWHGMSQKLFENDGWYTSSYLSRNITTDEGKNYIMQNIYRVEVDSEGVLSVETMLEYEMGEELSASPEMMSFEQIDKIAQDYMREQCMTKTEDSNIDTIELRYLTLLYDGKYVMMPVWIYSGVSYSDSRRKFYSYDVMVNAVDGTIIKTRKMLEGDGN